MALLDQGADAAGGDGLAVEGGFREVVDFKSESGGQLAHGGLIALAVSSKGGSLSEHELCEIELVFEREKEVVEGGSGELWSEGREEDEVSSVGREEALFCGRGANEVGGMLRRKEGGGVCAEGEDGEAGGVGEFVS